MFGLVSGDVRDGSEDICPECRRTFDAIPVVGTTLSGFVIGVKVLKDVVKVDRAIRYWPKVACVMKMVVTSMCRFRQRGMTTLLFVEMRDNGSVELLGKALNGGGQE